MGLESTFLPEKSEANTDVTAATLVPQEELGSSNSWG